MSGRGSRLRRWTGLFLLVSSLLAYGQFETPESAMQRADTALGQGRFDVAQGIYARTLEDNPNLSLGPDRCRNIAEANARATHPNLKVAIDWLQKAVDKAGDRLDLRQRLGELLLRNGESARAATQYRYLVDKDSSNQQNVLGLAVAMRNLGQFDDAGQLLTQTLAKHPDYNLLHIEYGRTLSYERSFQQALDQYQQVLKSEPDNIAALLGIAKVRSWQGYQDQALVEYDKVLQRDPSNYDAIVGQAFSLIWTGRKNEAIPLLERANSRHPEDAEVREALKRLGGVNVFTGDISAGDPPLPILPPAIKKVPGKSTAKIETSSSSSASAEKNPENNPPQPTPGEQPPVSSPTSGTDRHTVLWLVGMGVTMMVAVFAVAGFLLFVVPAARKKRENQSIAITNPLTTSKPMEPWARLEELSRGQEEAKAKRSTSTPVSSTPAKEVAKVSDPASDPWYYVPERPKPTPAPYEAAPSNGDESTRLPRRRRGVAERPWWRETPLPETSSDAEPKTEHPAPQPPTFAAPTRPTAAPLIDAHDSDTVVVPSGFANPLTPAAERPAPPEEEPTSPRPFTLVLSKALERAGDGHFEESASPEPLPKEESSFEEGSNGHKTPTAAEPEPEVAPIDAQTRAALQGLTAVIVGCGVMVTHYRAVLRAAGIDVRTFTFWDLAMTSMRKRRADILLIDGDTLDGFTTAQMYTSAQVERYMFGTVLVGIGSGEDRTKLPDDVLLPHSLSDQDFRERLVEALRTR